MKLTGTTGNRNSIYFEAAVMKDKREISLFVFSIN